MFTRDKGRREKITEFITAYIHEHGYAPSVREIGRAVGIRSTKAVKYHLDVLVKQGVLQRTAGKARSLKTATQQDALPLIGRIAAGSPVMAVENVEEHIKLSSYKDCFLLKVHGESMRDAGIIDGDMVIVQPKEEANNNEIVAVLIGDEATVKKFRREDDKVVLMPENPDFKPIVLDRDSGDFKIVGAVVGLMRNYQKRSN
jgi:repressor LexA